MMWSSNGGSAGSSTVIGSGSSDGLLTSNGSDFRRSLSGNLEEMVEERPHLDTLVAACKECMSACSLLQRVLPELPLTSAAAPDVHGMVYTLTSLEVALHQFIERELLHEAPGTRRRSDSGQRLQDALERTSRALKPAAKASLLAGGIASLLYLFAETLRTTNAQLGALLEAERRGGARKELALAAGCALAGRLLPRRAHLLRRAAALGAAAAAARAAQLWLKRRRLVAAIGESHARLLLVMRLWALSTSMLQRAHRAVASSYIDLHRQDSSDSLLNAPLNGGVAPPLGTVNYLPSNRSYTQLIATPGLVDVDDERKSTARQLWDSCCPWTDASFWWRLEPLMHVTRVGIDVYYASMFAALRIGKALRLPPAAAYALALGLAPWYACNPRRTADAVYSSWLKPDIYALQAVFAPLRWEVSVRAARALCGRGVRYRRVLVRGVRLTLMSPDDGGGEVPGRPGEVPARPVILFVPGGAFITDFEAADLFFLHRWVRETRATVAYVSYGYSPQAPYPRGQLQVLTAFRALRDGSHAAQLGFRAEPLVLAGLSAGGNLAVSAILAPLLPQHCREEALEALPPPAEAAMPDAVLLLCPVLNVCRSPSPSRTAFSSDVLLPQPLLKAYAEAYDQGNEGAWMDRDPLLSPVFAPDAALQRLPPTHILVGGLDPLLDDSVDFNTRIRRMGVAGELRIYRSLPHTFVSFPHWHVLPEVQAALRQSIELLQAACWPHTAAAAEAAKAAAAHAQYGIGGTESEEEAKDVSMPMRPRAGSITRGRGV